MRKMLWLILVGAGAFAAWQAFRDRPTPALSHRAPAVSHSAPRSISELEELVYRDPFNPDKQLELARAYWLRFDQSMKTDQDAASQSLTGYMIACVESGSRKDALEEFQSRLATASQLASLPQTPFNEGYSNLQLLYNAMRPQIERIIKLRDEYESVWNRIPLEHRRPEVIAAQEAVTRYLRSTFDVEVGRKRVILADGSGIKFVRGFYDPWERGLRSYGLIVGESNEPMRDYMLGDALSSLPEKHVMETMSGDSIGRFHLSDGREAIPGLRYFSHLAGEAPAPGAADTALSAESPSDVYRRFLKLRSERNWSAMYDMFDTAAQQQMAQSIKETLRPLLPDPADGPRLDQMSGRKMFEALCSTARYYPTEIVSEEIDGATAVVHTRAKMDTGDVDNAIHFVRDERGWMLSWDTPLTSGK